MGGKYIATLPKVSMPMNMKRCIFIPIIFLKLFLQMYSD